MKQFFGFLGSVVLLFICSCWDIEAQNGEAFVRGTVKTSDGTLLPGATVLLTGTKRGTTSDMSGNFTLDRVKEGTYTLRISFQGYKSYEKELNITSGNNQTLEVVLEEKSYEMSEVVVTTQKREQTNIDVPIAISALSGKTLEKLNINDFDVLAQYVPGLQIQLQSPNNPGFVIRGITSDDGDARVQPRVSVFQDGVSISRARGAVVELFDMERVEVVKGPQGTLFGRSAQIGAVHLIENKPGPAFSGSLDLGYGNYNQKIASGYLNTPLVKDNLYNRFSFRYNERDGFIENKSGGRLNGKNTVAFRDIIRLLPGKKTIADLIVNFQHDDYPGTSFKSGSYAPAGGTTDPNSAADLDKGDSLGILRNVGGATLLVNHDLSSAWKLNSISAYRSFYANESFDADGTKAPALWFSEIAKGKQWSQEFRFNYDNKTNLSGFLGGSFFYEDGSQKVPFRTNEQSLYALISSMTAAGIQAQTGLSDAMKQALISAIYMPLLTNGVPNTITNVPNVPAVYGSLAGAPLRTYHEEESTNYGTTRAFELFADGTFSLTKNLFITAGLRGTYENLTGGYESAKSSTPGYLGYYLGLYPNILSYPSGKLSLSKDYYSYVGRLALNYKIKNTNIYASISRGRRPGVIQITTSLAQSASKLDTSFLQPEIVWSYEAGMKGLLFDNILGYDITVYHYDWSHFQTTVENASGLPHTIDAGMAHSFGIESGLRYTFLKNNSVFANYGFINGKFNDKDDDGNAQAYAGNTFRLTPKHTFSAGLDLNVKLNSRDLIYFRPDYSYKSKVFFEDNNTDLLSQKGYALVNMTAGIALKRIPRYQIGVFAKNLMDQKYIIDAGNTGNSFGIPTFIGGTRRTFGVEMKLEF